MNDLTDVDSHFDFGKNWASYAALAGERELGEARKGLLKLLPEDQFPARSFLDIGCGSGIHSLAAAGLGAARVVAVDIDADSVATTRSMLERAGLDVPWEVHERSVFDLSPETLGTFDIVYSWGVLHHTGDMWRAIEKAASVVAPQGSLVVALYRSTRLDWFWRREKRLYAAAPAFVQKLIRAVYFALLRLTFAIRGKSYADYVKNYHSIRGMDHYHDVHDWLGGYPYETALAPEIDRKLNELGFKAERVFARPMSWGWLGSGCDEYVYRRN